MRSEGDALESGDEEGREASLTANGSPSIAEEAKQSALIGRLLGDVARNIDELLLALQFPGLSPRVQRIGYEELQKVVEELAETPIDTSDPTALSAAVGRLRELGNRAHDRLRKRDRSRRSAEEDDDEDGVVCGARA